jgi:hypothetical protein
MYQFSVFARPRDDANGVRRMHLKREAILTVEPLAEDGNGFFG